MHRKYNRKIIYLNFIKRDIRIFSNDNYAFILTTFFTSSLKYEINTIRNSIDNALYIDKTFNQSYYSLRNYLEKKIEHIKNETKNLTLNHSIIYDSTIYYRKEIDRFLEGIKVILEDTEMKYRYNLTLQNIYLNASSMEIEIYKNTEYLITITSKRMVKEKENVEYFLLEKFGDKLNTTLEKFLETYGSKYIFSFKNSFINHLVNPSITYINIKVNDIDKFYQMILQSTNKLGESLKNVLIEMYSKFA